MKTKKTFYSGIVVILAMLVIGIFTFDDSINTDNSTTTGFLENTVSQLVSAHPVYAKLSGDTTIADVAEKTVVSVVNIASTQVVTNPGNNFPSPFLDDPFFKHFFGPQFRPNGPSKRRQNSLGSGVIISEDGIILTNNHVVQDAEEIKITLHDEREFEGEIVGTDPQSDLAVVRLKGDVTGIKPLPLGDSDALRLGDVVLAIGSPFGLSQTVTMGIVSAKGRNEVRLVDYENFIQTDAAINPGNSGGALVNLKGELVGINTAIASKSGGYQGIGFAIPSNMAKTIMQSLIDYGKVSRGWLGVGIQDISQEIAEAMNLSSTKGVLVSDVFEDSPAEKAGLKSGDVIIRVDGEKMESRDQLRNRIALIGPDKKVSLTILRDGKVKELRVKLGERADDARLAAAPQGRSGKEKKFDGLSVAPLNQSSRSRFQIPEEIDTGVVVTSVEAGSSAYEAGLQPGDVIQEINNKEVKSVEKFESLYDNAKKAVLLYIYRNGSHFYKGMKKQA